MSEGASRRFRATVHYDGRGYYGWQVQPDRPTVQGAVETALAELLQEPVSVASAGRTDRGVHAVGQEIAFSTPRSWSEPEMRRALNAVLPGDVWLEKLSESSEEFHPRFDATARRYHYLVATGPEAPSPLRRHLVWRLDRTPDPEILERLAGLLPGERSFEAFAKSGQPERGTRCRVERADWQRTVLGDLLFTIVADRFLHHMVRYLVQTMVEEATGRRDPGELEQLLAGEDGVSAPAPAPPGGLYLAGVRYPAGWNREPGVPGLSHPAGSPE